MSKPSKTIPVYDSAGLERVYANKARTPLDYEARYIDGSEIPHTPSGLNRPSTGMRASPIAQAM